MGKDKKVTQKTPKGHEIPVPTKEDVFKILKKSAKPIPKDSLPRSAEK